MTIYTALTSLLYGNCICFSKLKTAYELRISDWSSDVCSSDLSRAGPPPPSRPYAGGGTVTWQRSTPEGQSGPDSVALERVGVQDLALPEPLSVDLGQLRRFTRFVPVRVDGVDLAVDRSTERRVGEERVSRGRTRWWPYH